MWLRDRFRAGRRRATQKLGCSGGDQGNDGGYQRDRNGYYDGPYDGPYYGGYGSCPGGGYYDANGTYWYWDPDSGTYISCPADSY